jgi:hypothetical protein
MHKFLVTATTLALLWSGYSQADSYLRAVHTAENSPAVDIYLDDLLLEGKLEYTGVTPFKKVSSALHTLKITLAGKKEMLLESEVEMADDFAYVLELRTTDGALESNVGGFNLADREEGQTTLNFYYFAPGDISVDLKPSKGPAFFEDMSYLDASSINVSPFKGKLSLKVANKSTVLSEIPEYGYEIDKMYSIYVFPSKKGLELKRIEDIFP